MSLCGSGVFHTGTFVYLHEAEHAKNSHMQNMHKKKKRKNHKIIRNTQKKQKYFQEKEKNIVCSLHTSIAIMHNVTRSYEYEKGGFQR